MDDGDAAGYMHDQVLAFAKKYDITCSEDLYQMDEPSMDAIDLVNELLETAGIYEKRD